MNIYELREMEGGDALDLIERHAAWVPAGVAQGLYDALEQIRNCNSLNAIEMIAEKALAAADGDGGDDD